MLTLPTTNNTEKGYADMIKVIESKDTERVALIRQQLKENDGYCPCKLLRDENTKCICKEFREQIACGSAGKCHCGLYELVISE